MRCDDIEEFLADSDSDLRAVYRHLQTCPACDVRYRQDLMLEKSLRGLVSDCPTIDISDELSRNLSIKNRAIKRLSFIRSWVWVAAALAAVVLFLSNLSVFLGYLEDLYSLLSGNAFKLGSYNPADLHGLAKVLTSSVYFKHIAAITGVAAILIIVYLWRLFKESFAKKRGAHLTRPG